MNRKIKFRTWDTEYKEFSEWTNRDPFFDTSSGKIFFWERTRKEDGSYDGDIILENHGDRFVLQQYTGLKDKNGKEIYEGDILKYSNTYFESQGGQLANPIFQAEWVGAGFVFLGESALQEDADYYEICGNIFKNPELLWK